jgi:hypothetical protein
MLWWDRERAVDSNLFKQFLESNNIKLYHTYSEIKVSVVERVIRTLKTKCERIKTQYSLENKPYNLIEVLPVMLKQYNEIDCHSTIGMTPTEASNKSNEEQLKQKYQSRYDNYQPEERKNFEVGDHVRISSMKSLFEKGYTHNWSKEVFVINSVQETKPATYLLKDLSGEPVLGAFYGLELLHTSA